VPIAAVLTPTTVILKYIGLLICFLVKIIFVALLILNINGLSPIFIEAIVPLYPD